MPSSSIPPKQQRNQLRCFCNAIHPDSKDQLDVWINLTKRNFWKNVNELKGSFSSISILNNSRVVFNIRGNNYRLIVTYNFNKGIAFINWFGTHADYDKIDANNIWDH